MTDPAWLLAASSARLNGVTGSRCELRNSSGAAGRSVSRLALCVGVRKGPWKSQLARNGQVAHLKRIEAHEKPKSLDCLRCWAT
jgi:hypothetical protein